MRCLCINHLCAKKTEYGILQDFCLKGCPSIRVGSAFGTMPQLLDDDEIVFTLIKPPKDAIRLQLRQGGWTLPLPTRISYLDDNFVAIFTMMTSPAPRILSTTILEIHEVNQKELLEKLKEFYGDENVRIIELDKPSETKTYKIYMENRKRVVVFEVKI